MPFYFHQSSSYRHIKVDKISFIFFMGYNVNLEHLVNFTDYDYSFDTSIKYQVSLSINFQ